MDSELLNTWTPILKALPEEERESARELIEKYGETYPTSFIVELLQIFGVHGVYLQTIPKQVAIAGDYVKSQIENSIAASAGLHERARQDLNRVASDVGRVGTEFSKALERATHAQVEASAESTAEIKAKIQHEFEKQNLPALTASLKQINENAGKAVLLGKDTAAQLEALEQRCHQTITELNRLRWKRTWAVCASICAGLLFILAGFLYYGFRSYGERKLAEQIAQSSFTIENNREVFAELALANIVLGLNRSSDATTGKPIPSGYAIIVQNADGAEMRDYKGTQAGFIFLKSPKPEDAIRHLKLQVDEMMRKLDGNKK